MEKIEILRQKVKELYEAKHEGRADFADWIYANHVFVVADYAKELSERFGVDNELAEAAGMLHDIADAVISRFAQEHEAKSLEIARQLLAESGFSEAEIEIVVNDAVKNHSCYSGHLPETTEGKLVATADAKAHLDTDFYTWLQTVCAKDMGPDQVKAKLTEKIERDYHAKIFFPEVKEELKEVYEARKKEFGM